MSQQIDATCSECVRDRKGTYDVPAACINCGWLGSVRQSRGHAGYRWECPRCGCRDVASKLTREDEGRQASLMRRGKPR